MPENQKTGEVYFSVDVEATGSIPPNYSMYQLGACVVNREDEQFFRELKLLNANHEPEALAVCGQTLDGLLKRGDDPIAVMLALEEWVLRVAAGCRPVFVAFGGSYDWMFTHWYFMNFLGRSPFGHNGLDMKSYYQGLAGCSWSETSKSRVSKRFPVQHQHTHNALDDAIEQAQIFSRMLLANRSR